MSESQASYAIAKTRKDVDVDHTGIFFLQFFFFLLKITAKIICTRQTMTEAEYNRPNPKFFDNRPSASATEVFGETIGLVIFQKFP